MKGDLDVAIIGKLKKSQEAARNVVGTQVMHRFRKWHLVAGATCSVLVIFGFAGAGRDPAKHLLPVYMDVEGSPPLLLLQPRLQPALHAPHAEPHARTDVCRGGAILRSATLAIARALTALLKPRHGEGSLY